MLLAYVLCPQSGSSMSRSMNEKLRTTCTARRKATSVNPHEHRSQRAFVRASPLPRHEHVHGQAVLALLAFGHRRRPQRLVLELPALEAELRRVAHRSIRRSFGGGRHERPRRFEAQAADGWFGERNAAEGHVVAVSDECSAHGAGSGVGDSGGGRMSRPVRVPVPKTGPRQRERQQKRECRVSKTQGEHGEQQKHRTKERKSKDSGTKNTSDGGAMGWLLLRSFSRMPAYCSPIPSLCKFQLLLRSKMTRTQLAA